MVRTAFVAICFWAVAFQSGAQTEKKHNPLQSVQCKHSSHQFLSWQQSRQQQSTANLFRGHILRQSLHLELDPNIRYIQGYVDYSLLWTNQPPVFRIDIGDAIKDSSRLAGNTAVVLLNRPGTPTVVSFPNQLEISLPFTLNPNDTFQFRIYFGGEPYDDGNSFGSFRTATHGPNNSPVLWTLSQPYGAKDWWPNFQVLGQKADTTEMIITTPPGYYAGGMGLLENIDSSGSNWIHHWQHNYPCPPYLVGTAVSDYWVYDQKIAVNNGLDSIAVLNYLYAEDSVSWKIMLEGNLPPMLQLFTDLFGEYPFINEKYGHMQISNGDGGMEHNTMSSMGSYDYSLMAHELAHMWFGNKITCISWQDIWVNEGFASWMTGLTLERLLDNGYWWEPWKRLQKESAIASQDHVVFKQDTSIVAALFQNRSTYHKASMVIHQLRYVLGDSALFAATRSLITDNSLAYGFINTETVRQYMEAACQCSLRDYFDRWIYESGHPEYHIRWNDLSDGLQLHITDLAPGRPFVLPLPFRVYSAAGDSLDIRVDMTAKTLNTRITLPFRPVQLRFDPDIWLLAKELSLEKIPDRLVILYPENAAEIQLLLPESWEGRLASLELFDMLGRSVYRLQNPGDLAQYSLPLYPLGGQGVVVARHPDGRRVVGKVLRIAR